MLKVQEQNVSKKSSLRAAKRTRPNIIGRYAQYTNEGFDDFDETFKYNIDTVAKNHQLQHFAYAAGMEDAEDGHSSSASTEISTMSEENEIHDCTVEESRLVPGLKDDALSHDIGDWAQGGSINNIRSPTLSFTAAACDAESRISSMHSPMLSSILAGRIAVVGGLSLQLNEEHFGGLSVPFSPRRSLITEVSQYSMNDSASLTASLTDSDTSSFDMASRPIRIPRRGDFRSCAADLDAPPCDMILSFSVNCVGEYLRPYRDVFGGVFDMEL